MNAAQRAGDTQNKRQYRNGNSWVTHETAAKRMQDWKVCNRCEARFYRKGYQIPSQWRKQQYCSLKCGRAVRQPFRMEKFMSNVIAEPNSGCWLWAGFRDSNGYGTYWRDRKHHYAHRIMYTEMVGPILDDQDICHKCDNPSCVNPDHLFSGTHQENMDDMVRKGRRPSLQGSAHPMAKLTENDTLAIYHSKADRRALAKQYGVSKSTINAIFSGQNWSHVTGISQKA